MPRVILMFASVPIFKNEICQACIYIVFFYLYFLSVLDNKAGLQLSLPMTGGVSHYFRCMKTLQETNVLKSCNNVLQDNIDAVSDPTRTEHAFQNPSAPVPSNAAQSYHYTLNHNGLFNQTELRLLDPTAHYEYSVEPVAIVAQGEGRRT